MQIEDNNISFVVFLQKADMRCSDHSNTYNVQIKTATCRYCSSKHVAASSHFILLKGCSAACVTGADGKYNTERREMAGL